MIYGQWALALNLFTVAILAFLVANVIVSFAFWSIKNKIQNYTISTRKSLLWLCVLLPWIVAVTVTLFFSPVVQSGVFFVWLTELAHWHHPDVFYFLSWHSVSLVVFLGFSIKLIIQKLMLAYKNHHQVTLLRALATTKGEGVLIIDTPIPTAFTGGLIKPTCFISTGLIANLTSDDVEIIIEHELAHLHYSDPLKKWGFSFFSAYFTPNVNQVLVSMMAITMEQAADTFLVKNPKQAQNVASTIVKFTKLASGNSIHKHYSNELFVHFCRNSIEKRVLHLLSDTKLKPFPMSMILFCGVILTLISTTSVDSIHHAIETLLNH